MPTRFVFKKRFYFEVYLSQTSARFAPCSSLTVGGLHARPLCARTGRGLFSERTGARRRTREDGDRRVRRSAWKTGQRRRRQDPARARSWERVEQHGGWSKEVRIVRGGWDRHEPAPWTPGLSALPGPETLRQRRAAPEEEWPRKKQQQTGQKGLRQPQRWVCLPGEGRLIFRFNSTNAGCLFNNPTVERTRMCLMFSVCLFRVLF